MKERIIALLIDALIIMIIGYPIFWIVIPIFNITNDSDYYYGIVNIYFTLLYSCKDLLFRNASIGKKFLGLKVIKTNDEIPTIIEIYCRNLSTVIAPLELVTLVIFKKRLGDIIFKTKLISSN